MLDTLSIDPLQCPHYRQSHKATMADVQEDKERVSNLSLADRKSIYLYLEAKKKNRELPRGSIKACANSCRTKTSRRVFNEILKKVNHWKIDRDGDEYPDILFQDGQRNNGGTIKHNGADVQANVPQRP